MFVASQMLQDVCGVPITAVKIGPTSRYAKEVPHDFERFSGLPRCLNGFKVDCVNTHGKFMYWSFSDTVGHFDVTMMVTHGMSGRWVVGQSHEAAALKHAVITFDFTDGRSAVFVDPRHFGTIKFGNMTSVYTALSHLGDDIRHLNVTKASAFVHAFMKHARERTICEALMDQRVLAGVGNYIKAEVLWRVKMSPWRIVRDIKAHEFTALQWALVDVFELAVATRGASFKTHLNPDGTPGKTADFFQVYSKRHDPNGLVVVKQETPDGRVTHWVPGWQW